MRAKLSELEKQYPRLMKLESTKSLFGLEHKVKCGKETCMTDVVTISDFQDGARDKVEVYISGTLHGDERVGPHVAYYLIEYLLTNFDVDYEITNLLKHREIVITPMTNAVGYYFNERTERINKDHPDFKANKGKTPDSKSASKYDINRDFPYN
mmetsp:Transcript_34259/g.25328  ORF Transcript_34259/g.25328 Transcript_34259/m.25328 type:complete len:154 (-) Transcript_34259:1653-2114(-)|eukprot:CAMPEP_0202962224 /NCGR_PEP_ID=MMETSP1396-20130829/6319_1 /ASSEMBLY_ACC=CAM_ASM_000872 /TAXON_ID= /ORGANISM="Pseudokeronopsis sp., Strain Brazil" /LENGTH=153 /DNA_ID=CAMNT_0049682649 /DNA_START=103 /DNA_END=564 /DNA_ORIENTATION=+